MYHSQIANPVCCSAAKNAADSRLLRLPPEIRCRIYDYAFGSCPVHVNASYSDYKFTNCSSPQDCEVPLLQRRTQQVSFSGDPSDRVSESYEDCKNPLSHQKAGSRRIPVHMLQVCRQIYYEAALKPFTEASFHIVLVNKNSSQGSKKFLRTLVPTQARAIAHLRISFLKDQFLSSAMLPPFSGLKHVEIHIATDGSQNWIEEPLRQLQAFETRPGFKALKKLDLKSLRLTVSIQRYEASEALEVAVLECIGRLEVGITHDVPSEHQETAAVTELV